MNVALARLEGDINKQTESDEKEKEKFEKWIAEKEEEMKSLEEQHKMLQSTEEEMEKKMRTSVTNIRLSLEKEGTPEADNAIKSLTGLFFFAV